jgi:hypothetical protein
MIDGHPFAMANTIDPKIESPYRAQTAIAFAALVTAVICFVCAGRPHASNERLWWIGPALGVAENGSLRGSPYVGAFPEAFGTEYFFCQPPVFFFLLGGWIKLFGLSTGSVTAFYWTTLLGAMGGAYSFFWRFGLSPLVALLGCALFLFTAGADIRPDLVAYIFCFPAAIQFLHPPQASRYFLAGLFSVLSVMSYPLPIVILIPVFAISLIDHLRKKPRGAGSLARAVMAALGGAVLGLLVCSWMLEGRWGEFFRVLTAHRASRTGSVFQAPGRFWELVTRHQEWLLTAPFFVLSAIGFLGCSWLRHRIPGPLLRFGWLTWSGTAMAILLYPENAIFIGRLFAWAFILSIAWHFIGSRKSALVLLFAAAWLLSSQGLQIVALLFQQPADPAELGAAARRLKALEGRRLVVDGPAAQYFYGSHPPPGTRSMFFGVPSPNGSHEIPFLPADASWKRPGEVWVFTQASITRNGAFVIPGFPAEVYAPNLDLCLFGHSFHSIPREPYRFFVVE